MSNEWYNRTEILILLFYSERKDHFIAPVEPCIPTKSSFHAKIFQFADYMKTLLKTPSSPSCSSRLPFYVQHVILEAPSAEDRFLACAFYHSPVFCESFEILVLEHTIGGWEQWNLNETQNCLGA